MNQCIISKIKNEVCQICRNLDQEDIGIINEMLLAILKPYLEKFKATRAVYSYIFSHDKFKKSLVLTFQSKYVAILEQCQHVKFQKVFPHMIPSIQESMVFKLFKNHLQDTSLLEKGLNNLFQDISEKQVKIKVLKESFETMAQLVLNCNQDCQFNNSESQSSNQDEPDQPEDELNQENEQPDAQLMMKFNKNSNKNKFQKRSIDILKKWFLDNLDNPYPDQNQKMRLSQQTGMHVRQIQNWFTNSRKRYLEPLKKNIKNQSVNRVDNEQIKNKQVKMETESQMEINQPNKIDTLNNQLKVTEASFEKESNNIIKKVKIEDEGRQQQKQEILGHQPFQEYSQAAQPFQTDLSLNSNNFNHMQYWQWIQWQRQMNFLQMQACFLNQQQIPAMQFMKSQEDLNMIQNVQNQWNIQGQTQQSDHPPPFNFQEPKQ